MALQAKIAGFSNKFFFVAGAMDIMTYGTGPGGDGAVKELLFLQHAIVALSTQFRLRFQGRKYVILVFDFLVASCTLFFRDEGVLLFPLGEIIVTTRSCAVGNFLNRLIRRENGISAIENDDEQDHRNDKDNIDDHSTKTKRASCHATSPHTLVPNVDNSESWLPAGLRHRSRALASREMPTSPREERWAFPDNSLTRK